MAIEDVKAPAPKPRPRKEKIKKEQFEKKKANNDETTLDIKSSWMSQIKMF